MLELPVVSKIAPGCRAFNAGVVLASVLFSVILISYFIPGEVAAGYWAIIILLCVTFLVASIYYVIKSYKIIIVSSLNITVKYPLLRKEIVIDYSEINNVNTYRIRRDDNKYGTIFSQSFLIELADGRSISFSFQDYLNYDDLKAAIYKYKLGIGA